jgi:predicted TIM-barrel fold metal-dependent hydrolase
LDTHVHLYDPTRPQGIPWPPKTNELIYKKTLPDRLREVTQGLGVVGAIKVEASPWLEDNQWVLEVIEQDPLMVGTIGNLEAETPEFAAQLDRFGANPLFLGIRYGYLWDRSLREALTKPVFVESMKLLAVDGDAFAWNRHGLRGDVEVV